MTSPVTVTFLGGLGEVGRNCTVIEYEGRLIVIDFGLMFPSAVMPGVDVILPDDRYLQDRADRIDGLIITHAHEDHVGGVPYFFARYEAPLYGSALSMAIADHKLSEAGLGHMTSLNPVADGDTVKIGPFEVEFLPITHSVPQSMCIVVHTPQGVVVHTGDFKVDDTPIDNRLTDLRRLGALSEDPGIRLLLADSTNADSPGRSASESSIGETFRRLFPEYHDKRIIASCFASHLHRVQQLADVAIDQGRYVFPLGRSMVNNVRIARELGVLDIPERWIRPIDEVDSHPPEKVCVVCTGSQGEPMAALSLLAKGEQRTFGVGSDDMVLLTSSPIPGNERAVYSMIDALTRRGCEVVHSGMEHVHTSGHAKRDELRTFHNVVSPEWFIPIEGEFRMLRRHADLALDQGMDPDRVILALDGDQISLTDRSVTKKGSLPHQYRYVQGRVESLDDIVLADRMILSKGGFVNISLTVDPDKGRIVSRPAISTRGWITEPHFEELESDLEKAVTEAVTKALDKGAVQLQQIEKVVRRTTGKFVADRTGRRPAILAQVHFTR